MYSSIKTFYIHITPKVFKFFLLIIFYAFALETQAQNINKPNKSGPMGTQVNTQTGNLFLARNDEYIPARGFDILVAFNYNSYNFRENSGYGNGWSFNYSIKYQNDTANSRTIIWGDGRSDNYTLLGGGGYRSPKGFFNTLTQYQPNKYLLTELNGTKFYFDNNIHKKITRMEDPNGNYINFNYTDTLLTSLTNTAGQSISFTYNSTGLLASMIDALASPTRTYTYAYEMNGDLKQVTDPLGGQNKYSYLVNGPLKSISDKNSNTVDVIYYNDFSVSEVIGCNKRVSFSYDTATLTTFVTDYLTTGTNQVTKYTYRKTAGQTWLSSISGNCCGYTMSFEFDENGNKIKETDANGNTYHYTYDIKGNLLTSKDPLERICTYTYSQDLNLITSYTDYNGNVTSMTYDAAGNMIQLTEPGNNISTATYNSHGDLVSSTDPMGYVYQYMYDSFGNPAKITGPNSFQATFTSNARGNLETLTDARNNSYTLQYDILNRMKKIVDPVNNSRQFNYDAEGNLTSVLNPRNEIVAISYDASNRPIKLTDPMGYQKEIAYDGMDNMLYKKNALGNKSSYSYDSRNRMSSIKDAANNISNLSYDANGNLTLLTLPTGQQYTYTYDKSNRIIKVSDINGTIGAYTYDKNNRITSFTNGAGSMTSATYDERNRLKSITDPLGNSVQMAYDKNNHLTSLTDRNGSTIIYTYDSLNRIKSCKDKNNNTISLNYDITGNIIQATDQNNNTTQYTYDSLNRTKTVTYPDGKYLLYGYDSKNNTISKRLTDGTTISYQYDSLNRLITKILPDGQTFSYAYDAQSRMIAATNNAGTVTLTYDALNRISSESFDGRFTRYDYSIAGRTQTIIYPDSTVVARKYDTRNRLISVAKNNVTLVSYQYNSANQIISKTFSNGISTTLQYDFASRLSHLVTAGGTIQNTTYSYDKERNKTVINRLNNPSLSEQFSYDPGHRLTNYKRGIIGATPTLQNIYSFDAAGNRTQAMLNGITTNYTTNNLNQLTDINNGIRSIIPLYDNNGNVLYDGHNYKSYDAEGRLLKDSVTPAAVVTYQYDAFNRKVQKNTNGVPVKFAYSGLAAIEERDGISNSITGKTIFSGFLTPVWRESNNMDFFYHQNELNSVEAITNNTGGLTERYQYDDYGTPVIYDSANNLIQSSVVGNRFAFTGQDYDSTSGNYNFLYRNYSPATGTFNQRDLIGYADGMGLYQYVHDNPANGIDILGLDTDCDPEDAWKKQMKKEEDWFYWIMSNTSNTISITSVTHTSSLFMNAPVLNIVFTPINAITTYNNGTDLSKNWSSKTYGQQVDGVLGVTSGTLSTLTGGAVSATIGGGTVAEMAFGGATFSEALMASMTTAGELFAGTAAGAGVVAAGGGLAIYGLTNEATKVVSGGQSLSDLGEGGEDFLAQGIQWYYGPGHLISDDPVGEQKWEKHTDQNFIGSTTYYRMTQKYINASNKVLAKGSHGGGSGPNWNARNPCPPNGGAGGTQKPNPNPNGNGPGNTKPVIAIGPKDPNAIIGPDGQPDKHWVSVHDRLPYTILYENDKSASAPAKFVRVTTPIEPKQDAASFQLGNFGFNNQLFAVPTNTASYYQRLDCRDSLGLYVDITAGYDQLNNVAFWEFQSIDPVTLLPPSDPFKGFLSLQDSTQPLNGHGFVNFSIKPLQSAVTLDTIGAKAAIVFDFNDTIPTNIAKNTIDAFAPVSHMNSLPGNSINPVSLSWGGTDDLNGCGLKSYTLYVSNDGTNFSILRSGIIRTDTTFNGTQDTRYYFFVLATDSVGNTETLRQNEIRSTYIGSALPVTWLSFTGFNRDKNNFLNWSTASEQHSREYKVERSLNGSNFTVIGSVPAAGNSNTVINYQYTDKNIDKLNSPVMFYRIRQVDLDNNFKYSGIIRLNYYQTEPRNSIVYPNPTQGMITLSIGDKQLIGTMAVLFDETGKILQQVKITADSQVFWLDKYVNGIYFIRLSNKEVFKVVKQ